MHLKFRNVNEAFVQMVAGVERGKGLRSEFSWREGEPLVVPNQPSPSRYGHVYHVNEPVLITYTHPKERVLFNWARDANPFFHLYEALWMLAGRNDVAPLAYYNSRMKEFSDDGETLNGAYGYRWRKARAYEMLGLVGNESAHWRDSIGGIGLNETENDQLTILVNHLQANPTSRRAVLQMWSVEDDLLKIGGGCTHCRGKSYLDSPGVEERYTQHRLKPADKCPHCNLSGISIGSKDVCCNLSVMFSLRMEPVYYDPGEPDQDFGERYYLDMTVTNRSNDMVWGLLGANFVHFTFLQEYMATMLRAEVGLYHHFTNNLHVYTSNWKPDDWLEEVYFRDAFSSPLHRYGLDIDKTVPLLESPKRFETELAKFVEYHSRPQVDLLPLEEPFLKGVAQPVVMAFHAHKRKETPQALQMAEQIVADDWKIAVAEWLQRRIK